MHNLFQQPLRLHLYDNRIPNYCMMLVQSPNDQDNYYSLEKEG